MSEPPDSGPLPEWPLRAPGLLIVAGPHAIPISTAVRAGDRRLILGLSRRRETLARLREDPHAAFALLAEGLAFTAYGQADVLREKLEGMPNLAASSCGSSACRTTSPTGARRCSTRRAGGG